uniref:Uncharacterized protein n=1 Tax=Apteryx owenii TaxID=8824 RepID=A0A8B9QGI0_APTOW
MEGLALPARLEPRSPAAIVPSARLRRPGRRRLLARLTHVPLSPQECVREKLSLIHGFLQADVQNQLIELETKLRREELSERWKTVLMLWFGFI